MNFFALTIVSSYGVQALLAIAVGVLLFHFFTRYHKGYVLQWSNGWFAFFVFHAAIALDLYLGGVVSVRHPVRVVCDLLAGISLFLFIYWLLAGCFELAHQRPMRADAARRFFVVGITLGVLLALLVIALDQDPIHELIAVGLPALIISVALATGALTVRKRGRRSGFALLLAVLLGASLVRLAGFVMALMAWQGEAATSYPRWLAAFDLVALASLGLAMIIALLEDEREAALLAASEIEHLAYHDGLTGLPNRALFFDRLTIALAHARRYASRIAVVFIDLDRFKEINDSLGHSTGDTLLRIAATRIRDCIRQEDTVARFGGDEFTVVVHNVGTIDDLMAIADKILARMREPFPIGSRELVATASVGISVFPDDGDDVDTLVKNADTAMYRAKEGGRDRFQLYAREMNARAVEKLELENALRKALPEQQLIIHYQPLYDIRRGEVFGLEALVRWKHPKLGLLHPTKFIPVAESSGLIVPIGAWVLRESCLQGRKWQLEKGLNLVMSVNLSARQFQHPGLLEEITNALADTGFDPHYLEIEITESIAVQNVEHTASILRELKTKGIRVAIDDFGTGYSSLSYLKQFPIDTIKLDRSFVRDITAPQDAAIATSVITMAHSLNMKVMAEGVENEEQLAFLKQEKCDRLQGYFYSVPLSSDGFERFAEENRWLFKKET
jgi:diguanylate cyclase (GGDEF)-like protein